MNHFLDTRKALPSVSSSGTDTKDEDRENMEHKASYTKRPIGVASGHEASHDDPEVGGKYGAGGTVDEELEGDRKENNKKATKQNLIPVKKSSEAVDMLKSLTSGLEEVYQQMSPSELEAEFLVSQGHAPESVAKGIHWIAGKDRDLFDNFVCDRMQKSLEALLRCV